jgi:hypothetical protein
MVLILLQGINRGHKLIVFEIIHIYIIDYCDLDELDQKLELLFGFGLLL